MGFFMANHVLLNNIDHQDIKIITDYAEELGDNVNAVMTFPTEFADILREYPIFFRKDPNTGEYQSVAILGFEKGENLFLDDNGWQATYIPGVMARGPFLIGFQQQEVEGELRKEPVIHMDMDSPRVNREKGEPVFLPHGGNSPYLERVATILNGIHQGMAVSKAMFAAFAEADLIEPVSIKIELNQDMGYTFEGYYTINEERLNALTGEMLEKLHQSGFLQGAYLVLASQHNIRRLADKKNRRLLQEQTAMTES